MGKLRAGRPRSLSLCPHPLSCAPQQFPRESPIIIARSTVRYQGEGGAPDGEAPPHLTVETGTIDPRTSGKGQAVHMLVTCDAESDANKQSSTLWSHQSRSVSTATART